LISAQPRTPPPCHTKGQSLAYVIYTSGSTGTPKGVMIEQRSLLNYVLWLQREFSLAPSDRLLQSTPTSFDISILELFWPLVAGASLEVAPPGAHRSPNELIGLVQRREITVLQVVPSMLEAVVEVAGFAMLTSLRRVFTAGEVLDAGLARRFHAQSAAELINGYGPTETTVYSTYWRCDPAAIRPVVPIGRPLANTRVWILDPHGAPVPIGVPGEIHVAGDGVARGYLGRSELTAQRFVPDPFGRDALARMYRTGDRARYLPDGNIEFLGRVDHQVKLRGFRIELGEIEAVLARQPQVREAVVQLRVDTPGDPRLVAYVTADEPPADLTERLRARLRASLPEYMVPAHFVILEQLPVMPNGKIDRKALPAPGYCPEELGGSYVAARSTLEKQIAEVWCEVLKIERVGVLDNFFELGGHSLLAAQVISRLNTNLNVELPLRQMFEAPTVAGLARDVARIDRGAGSGTDDHIPRG
jgi:amino acid adenylation domain-containing protein